MTQRPAESTVSGDYIFETRTFDDTDNDSYSNYSQVQRTSTYGDELDRWGATSKNPWVASDINSHEFGVEFSFTPSSAAGARVTVHAIRVTVCYELSGSKGTVSGVAGNSLMGVDVHGPLQVCCGVEGKIFTSADGGVNWTERTSGTTQDLWEVAWDVRNQKYVCVGNNGTVLTSPDGVTWTIQGVGSGQDLRAIETGVKTLLGGTNEEQLIGLDIDSLEFGRSVVDPYEDPN